MPPSVVAASRLRPFFLRGLASAKTRPNASNFAPVIMSSRGLQTSAPLSGGGGPDAPWCYRQPPQFSEPAWKSMNMRADAVMILFWWWMLWNLFTQPEHLTGPGLPDPKDFTDEELGIPPDDE